MKEILKTLLIVGSPLIKKIKRKSKWNRLRKMQRIMQLIKFSKQFDKLFRQNRLDGSSGQLDHYKTIKQIQKTIIIHQSPLVSFISNRKTKTKQIDKENQVSQFNYSDKHTIFDKPSLTQQHSIVSQNSIVDKENIPAQNRIVDKENEKVKNDKENKKVNVKRMNVINRIEIRKEEGFGLRVLNN